MTRFNGNKKAGIFVALTVMAAMVIEGYTPSTLDRLQDIWNSPGRLTTIENDINEINEMIRFIEDGDRAITLLDQ